MRCFTVTESSVHPQISIEMQPYPHISAGSEGYGRSLGRLAVARRFAESLPKPAKDWERPSIGRASVIKTKEKGTLLVVEELDPADRRALVKVAIGAGYRGSTVWTHPHPVEQPCPNRGRIAMYESCCPECGVQCEGDGGQYTHPASTVMRFTDHAHKPVPGITELAVGYCAQGAAGRMGGHRVAVVIFEPGAVLRVKRLGRLYGDPAERIVLWDGETLRLGTRDEIWPPSEEAPEGEPI